MTNLWIATGNAKKRIELDRLLNPLGFNLRLQSEAGEEIHVVDVKTGRPIYREQELLAGNELKAAEAMLATISTALPAQLTKRAIGTITAPKTTPSIRTADAKDLKDLKE